MVAKIKTPSRSATGGTPFGGFHKFIVQRKMISFAFGRFPWEVPAPMGIDMFARRDSHARITHPCVILQELRTPPAQFSRITQGCVILYAPLRPPYAPLRPPCDRGGAGGRGFLECHKCDTSEKLIGDQGISPRWERSHVSHVSLALAVGTPRGLWGSGRLVGAFARCAGTHRASGVIALVGA